MKIYRYIQMYIHIHIRLYKEKEGKREIKCNNYIYLYIHTYKIIQMYIHCGYLEVCASTVLFSGGNIPAGAVVQIFTPNVAWKR